MVLRRIPGRQFDVLRRLPKRLGRKVTVLANVVHDEIRGSEESLRSRYPELRRAEKAFHSARGTAARHRVPSSPQRLRAAQEEKRSQESWIAGAGAGASSRRHVARTGGARDFAEVDLAAAEFDPPPLEEPGRGGLGRSWLGRWVQHLEPALEPRSGGAGVEKSAEACVLAQPDRVLVLHHRSPASRSRLLHISRGPRGEG